MLAALVGLSAAATIGISYEPPEALARAKHPPKRGKARRRSRHTTAGDAGGPVEKSKLYATCPLNMVSIRGQFCIDRYEAATVEAATGYALSPYYPPHGRLLSWVLATWGSQPSQEQDAQWNNRDGGLQSLTALHLDGGSDSAVLSLYAALPLPEVPSWQVGNKFQPVAVSRPGVLPQGHMPGFVAYEACRRAGKRLCRESEWVTACRGERGWRFPYGHEYRQGACNIFRSDHPARLLHGDSSTGLNDPRLNLMTVDGAPLLRETGATPLCKSVWGNDAIYDMVGNLDEWVDDREGLFLGGSYSRASRHGCEAKISAHPIIYFDYSTGFRCCADLGGAMPPPVPSQLPGQ